MRADALEVDLEDIQGELARVEGLLGQLNTRPSFPSQMDPFSRARFVSRPDSLLRHPCMGCCPI